LSASAPGAVEDADGPAVVVGSDDVGGAAAGLDRMIDDEPSTIAAT